MPFSLIKSANKIVSLALAPLLHFRPRALLLMGFGMDGKIEGLTGRGNERRLSF